jgi:hypothetical protein
MTGRDDGRKRGVRQPAGEEAMRRAIAGLGLAAVGPFFAQPSIARTCPMRWDSSAIEPQTMHLRFQ